MNRDQLDALALSLQQSILVMRETDQAILSGNPPKLNRIDHWSGMFPLRIVCALFGHKVSHAEKKLLFVNDGARVFEIFCSRCNETTQLTVYPPKTFDGIDQYINTGFR